MVSVPAAFFSEVLPLIDDLGELQLTLYAIWALQQKEGDTRYLRQADFAGKTATMHGLSGDTLNAALERAIQRQTLLPAQIIVAGQSETVYFANTPAGRHAVKQIDAGAWTVNRETHTLEILPERPSVYKLYEDNIGPLTPLIADDLKDTEAEFGVEWLTEAIRISVQMEKRSLRYVRAILERWKKEGKTGEEHQRPDEQDDKRTLSGKYADFFER